MSDIVKILYVDDEQGNLDYFRTVFRREYQVITAKSGMEGLELLKMHPDVSVIFTDQRMPKMTGVEFLGEVRKLPVSPIRILVTGYADMETVITAINEGHIFHYISKPWTYDEMKIIIGRALEHLQLMQVNRELLVQSERKEKEMVITELEHLRKQVNPHFLFNCLNTLYAMVPEQEDARDFIKKLANIYRYLLEHNKDNLVLVSEELDFTSNYFFLQNVRFNGAVRFENRVEGEVLNLKILSASLQLLVENTIKHNVVTKDAPLTVEVYTSGDFLVVKNNFQPKENVESTGTGQDNLKKRYSYISGVEPEFYEEEGFYYSKIPLILDK